MIGLSISLSRILIHSLIHPSFIYLLNNLLNSVFLDQFIYLFLHLIYLSVQKLLKCCISFQDRFPWLKILKEKITK